MKINKRSFVWLANCKTLLLLAVFALEVSFVKANDQHVFTDTIPIVEHKGHILMPVTINHELKHLVFDTGASEIFLWGDKKPFVTKWIDDAVDAKNHTEEVESGLVLAEFGSQCDSLIASYKPLPNDSSLRKALLDTGARYIKSKRSFDIAFTIEENIFKKNQVQLQIEDIRPNEG